MANTPKYTFVEDSAASPFFHGGLTALTGIAQERNESRRHKQRLSGFADVLEAQGLYGDANIYRNLADTEEPDLLAAALAGKAIKRDLSQPFDHALDAIKARENRLTQERVAGIRSAGSGNRMTLAEQRQMDQIDSDEQSKYESDANRIERYIDKLDRELYVAAADKDANRVRILEEQKTQAQRELDTTLKRRDEVIQSRRTRADRTFNDVPELPTASSGDPTGSYATDSVNNPDFSGLSNKGDINDGSLIPTIENTQQPATFEKSGDALVAGMKEADAVGGNPKTVVKKFDDGYSFALRAEQEIVPTVREESVTENKGEQVADGQPSEIAQREIDRRTFTGQARRSLPPNASSYQRRAAIGLGEEQDAAVARFPEKRKEIADVKNGDQLKALVKTFEKEKKFINEDKTPQDAAVRGRSMVAALAAQGGNPNDYILSMRVGSGGGYIPLVLKKSNLNQLNDSTWQSPDGTITYTADKDGFMHQTNNTTGESFLMINPDNPNAGITKAMFASGVAGLQNSPLKDVAPTAVNPSDKAIKRGQAPAKPGGTLDGFHNLKKQ